MTNPFLTSFDTLAHAAFFDAGMADVGTLRTIAGTVDCKVMVDYEPASADMGGVEFLRNQAVVKILREGISTAPRKDDVITITAEDLSTQVFTVDRVMRTDESMWEVLCRA